MPAPQWDITLSPDGQHHEDGAFPFRITQRNSFVSNGILEADSPYHYSHDFDGTSESDFWGATLNTGVDTKIGRVTSITGYRDFNNEDVIDSDFSPYGCGAYEICFNRSASFSRKFAFRRRKIKPAPNGLLNN